MSREMKFKYIYQHKDSGEIKTHIYTLAQIESANEEDLLFVMECDCEPIGETNVVECNCEDYLDGFHLIDRLQYTGLKDKNGVEAYHKDVVSCNGKWTAIVEYHEYTGGWYLANPTTGRYIAIVNEEIMKRIEVIGNIQQNPELLEEMK